MTAAAPVITRENSPANPPLSYAHAKAYAEGEAQRILPGRLTIVRPGIIIGPGDDTDRFTSWPVRVARGGEMLAPGDGSDHVQLIDVRDLVDFNLKPIEGAYSACSTPSGHNWASRSGSCSRACSVASRVARRSCRSAEVTGVIISPR